MMQSLLHDALDYAARGWSVVPMHAPVQGRCTCGWPECNQIGKHPHTNHGHKDATTDPGTIQLWFDLWPNANVGIATGARSSFFALDVDPRNGGADSLADLQSKHGPLPKTVEDITGGGGAAIWFEQPQFRVTNTKLAPGIDVRGDGGLIVAPYSLHKSGRRYEFEKSAHPDRTKIATAPDWLLTELERKVKPGTPTTTPAIRDYTGTRPRLAIAILHGTSKRAYHSRSEAEQAAITSLVIAGYTFDQVCTLFEREAHADTHYARLLRDKPHDTDRWLKLSYDEAVKFVARGDSPTAKRAREIANQRRVWALQTPTLFDARTSAYDQAATLAHCEIVKQCARDTYQLSARDLAESAGITPIAASRANKRLERLRVIRRVTDYDPGKPSQAIEWQLLPLKAGVHVGTLTRGENESECTNLHHHDAFRIRRSALRKGKWLGLGKIGAQIWHYLQDYKPHKLAEIATATRHHAKTARKTLGKMRAVGMVELDAGQWQAIRGVDLDRIAYELGTLGTAQRQQDRHRAERNHRRAALKRGAA